MKNAVATKKVAIVEVERKRTQVSGRIMGIQRVETAPVSNEIDLPMKAKKRFKTGWSTQLFRTSYGSS